MWEGVRVPQFLSQYLAKIEVGSAVYPNFSFRQLPWATISSYIVRIQTTWYAGGGRAPKFTIQYLPKIEVPIAVVPILASARFRQLPWPSGSTYIVQFR